MFCVLLCALLFEHLSVSLSVIFWCNCLKGCVVQWRDQGLRSGVVSRSEGLNVEEFAIMGNRKPYPFAQKISSVFCKSCCLIKKQGDLNLMITEHAVSVVVENSGGGRVTKKQKTSDL